MSRIAGYCRKNGRSAPKVITDAMLQQSKSRPEWIAQQVSNETAALGATSWRTPQLLTGNDLLVVVDGFFYNTKELPIGANDAVRFAALYREHGFLDALNRVNGDFAIALHDARARVFWLGRDRLGVRPLYYAADADGVAFGSRPRALFPVPGVSKVPNARFSAVFGASHYRYIDNAPEASPFRDIAQLPGSFALKSSDKGEELIRWWRLEDCGDFSVSQAKLAEQYRELLLDAVDLRMARAEKPAFTLSGGMDSSTVLASAVRTSTSKQVAFSTVYEDPTYDETEEIRTMLDSCVSEWNPVKVGTPDVFGLVERMVREHDEPVATGTWLSHFILCDEVSKRGFGSLFGGLGGDELNAGEYEYFFAFFADLKQAGRIKDYEAEVARWVEYHDHPIFKKSLSVADKTTAQIADLQIPGRLNPDRGRLERYAAALNKDYFDLAAYQPVMEHPFPSYLKNRTYQDLTRETAPCCLRAEDRQTVAYGLDNFLPFFDHRLVEFMYQVPGTLKIRSGVTKILLREATQGILPEETRARIKKTGWNAPGHVWFCGKGGERLLDLAHSRSFKERGIYNIVEIERIVAEHQEIVASGAVKENHMMFLWQMVNLEMWLRSIEAVPETTAA